MTYREHGATRGALPPGYRHVDRRDRIGAGPEVFQRSVDALTGWSVHRGAGLVLVAAPPRAAAGAVVVLRLGPPVVGLLVPCRVMYVIDQPDRRGFAYGTLPGHPESGEEAFILSLDGNGQVDLTIRAFSRPASRLVRAAGPLNRAMQDLITNRYVRALRRLVGP